MSADAACRSELDAELRAELADMMANMSVAPSRVTPPNGFRSGPPRAGGSHRASDRKMSLQERGRIARQPTIETKRVSITDADVSWMQLRKSISEPELHVLIDFTISFAGLRPAQPVQDE